MTNLARHGDDGNSFASMIKGDSAEPQPPAPIVPSAPARPLGPRAVRNQLAHQQDQARELQTVAKRRVHERTQQVSSDIGAFAKGLRDKVDEYVEDTAQDIAMSLDPEVVAGRVMAKVATYLGGSQPATLDASGFLGFTNSHQSQDLEDEFGDFFSRIDQKVVDSLVDIEEVTE